MMEYHSSIDYSGIVSAFGLVFAKNDHSLLQERRHKTIKQPELKLTYIELIQTKKILITIETILFNF